MRITSDLINRYIPGDYLSDLNSMNTTSSTVKFEAPIGLDFMILFVLEF